MKKIISFIGMFAVLGVAAGDARGVAMNANIRRLLQEKQDKIAKLEECEGKKQGWMIAGISTIGLTAVGVGVNIAQASKSNRLSSEIEMEKSTLEHHQDELNRINNDIAKEQAKKAKSGVGNGQGGSSVSTPAGGEMIEPFCCTVVVDDSNVPMSDFIGIIGCDDDANTTSSTDASGQFCFNKSMLSTAKCFIGGWSEGIEYGVFDSSIGELKRHCVDGKQKIMLCNTDSVPVQKLGQDCSGGTAVGVGVNIAQASKSNRLSSEIEMEKSTLEHHQDELNRIQNDIAAERAKQTTQKDGVKNEREKTGAKNANVDDSEFGSKSIDEFITNLRSTYSDISVKCGDNYTYVFIPGDEKTDEFARIKQECINAGGNDFVRVGDRIITINDKSQNVDLYQCKAEWKCEEKEIQPLESQIKKEDLFTSSGENAESGCEKYNHYEIKLSDNNTEYVYNFLYSDYDRKCTSRFATRCSNIGGEWIYGGNRDDVWEYRCWNPKALGRDYGGLGFDDFVKQECERYGGEANRSNVFMYYCVGIKNNECNKIKTAFEAAGYPDPITVSFDKKLKDAQTGAWTSFSGWQSKEVNWKNVCTIEAFGNDAEEYIYNPQ